MANRENRHVPVRFGLEQPSISQAQFRGIVHHVVPKDVGADGNASGIGV